MVKCLLSVDQLSQQKPASTVSFTTAYNTFDISSAPAATVVEDETANATTMESSTQAGSSKVPQPQGASEKMKPFLPLFPFIQSTYIADNYDECVSHTCQCASGAIAEWNRRYFARNSLCDIGFVFCLGHSGDPCPNQLQQTICKVTIVDVNGYHEVNLKFCFCWHAELDEAKQLFHHLLFPATLIRPEIIFTMDVLDTFDVHYSISTKSAKSFCAALQKMSAPELPDEVSDPYHTFMQASHIHHHLQAICWSGQAHHIDDFITHRRKNCIAVHCPACPDPGWNIDFDVLNNAPESEKHKYTLFLDCDGTFNVPRINKPDDPHEETLNAGRAYVIEEHAYQKYLSRLRRTHQIDSLIFVQKCDCAKLHALKFEHLLKFVNLVVMEIVGFQCVRHAFFKPDATIDMYAGERFYYADHGLIGVLKDQVQQRWICLSYDLVCQYLPNLLNRMTTKCIPELTDELLAKLHELGGNIGQLHIIAHILHCLALYSFNYTLKVGCSCGDNIESGWDKTKCAGGSLKQMNHGLHHDMLDFLFNDWNWAKVVRLSQHLKHKYIEAVRVAEKLEAAFVALTATHSPELVKKWESDAISTTSIKCPTMQMMVTDLLEKEKTVLMSDAPIAGMSEGITEAIMEGVCLDHEQQHLVLLEKREPDAKYQTEPKERRLQSTRVALYNDTIEWLKVIVEFFPALHCHTGPVDTDHPEKAKLPILSCLTSNQWVQCGLGDLVSIEYLLRVGQAHDILAEIRELIIGQSYNTRIVHTEFHGQTMCTQAHKFITRFQLDKNNAMHRYNHVHRHLIALGMSPTDIDLRELTSSHLTAKNAVQSRGLGDTMKPDSWLWGVLKPEGLTEANEDEWVTEIRHVKWMQDHADLD
ncbi:hypothetical protein IW262DRAFT_1463135 [Armillaria fumosa]|nr:hypothetical protein IW262DRAFT_1463135 [Armillaria fumosa]